MYAALNSSAPEAHGLWRVQTDGSMRRVGPLPVFVSLPNDITIDPHGNVYLSDSYDGRIWRLTRDGELNVWLQDDLLRAFFGDFEFGINGLVYAKSSLYAAITLNGRVIRIPIHTDGGAGTAAILVQDNALIGIDGVEPDARGDLYVTNNFASTVQRIRVDDLEIATITGDGLSAPGSLAFNRNQKTLYVANLSTSAGFPQPYAPALVHVLLHSCPS